MSAGLVAAAVLVTASLSDFEWHGSLSKSAVVTVRALTAGDPDTRCRASSGSLPPRLASCSGEPAGP